MNDHSLRVTDDWSVVNFKRKTIAARARELWVSCGEPVVPDDSIWREAERELAEERKYHYYAAERRAERLEFPQGTGLTITRPSRP